MSPTLAAGRPQVGPQLRHFPLLITHLPRVGTPAAPTSAASSQRRPTTFFLSLQPANPNVSSPSSSVCWCLWCEPAGKLGHKQAIDRRDPTLMVLWRAAVTFGFWLSLAGLSSTSAGGRRRRRGPAERARESSGARKKQSSANSSEWLPLFYLMTINSFCSFT